MHTRSKNRTAARLFAVLGWVGCGLLAGCGGKEDAPGPAPAPPKLAVQAPPSASTPQPAAPAPAPSLTPEARARLNQPFQEATLALPPNPDERLPLKTKTNKSVGVLYEAVVAEWARVPFCTADGKRLAYTATMKTALGVIKIELWPEVAPNHVRNFVALARAGYYNGLEFDRAVKREPEGGKGECFEYLEAGCPLGTGELGYGSIGYWLKPELSPEAKHEPGCVGAWHGEELESAACKFYITLSRAEWMDGNFTLFGKITQGVDVARVIRQRPARDDDRPVEPVVIRSVTIDCHERP
jgi:peptidyl-prolyl cis-trans isomerase B (cyclophilin B)